MKTITPYLLRFALTATILTIVFRYFLSYGIENQSGIIITISATGIREWTTFLQALPLSAAQITAAAVIMAAAITEAAVGTAALTASGAIEKANLCLQLYKSFTPEWFSDHSGVILSVSVRRRFIRL